MLARLMTVLLVLAPISALAQTDSEAGCKIIRELAPKTELQTIHANVLCLHERLDRLFLASQVRDNSEYVIMPPRVYGIGTINPCSAQDPYHTAMCQEDILRTFRSFCLTGDCAEGIEQWKDYMTPDWKQYLKPEDYDYTLIIGTWLQDIPQKQHLFNFSGTVQSIDMQKFFQEVPPSEVFMPRQRW